MKKKCQVLLLDSTEKSTIVINPSTGKIQYSNPARPVKYYSEAGFQVKEMYIVSDDEIKEGDYILLPNKRIHVYTKYSIYNNHIEICSPSGGLFKTKEKYKVGDCRKIIASTNKNIAGEVDGITFLKTPPTIPNLSSTFFEKFLFLWNKGNKIIEVMVEYEEFIPNDGINLNSGYHTGLKVDKNNQITITKVKDNYSTKEVESVLNDCLNDCLVKNHGKLKSWTSNDIAIYVKNFMNENL